jgi:hypothetical protein
MVSIIKDKIEFSSENFYFKRLVNPETLFPSHVSQRLVNPETLFFKPGNNVRYSLLEYVSEFIGKNVCFLRTVSKAGQTAKHSRKLQDFQMFPNLPTDYCLLINIPI